MFSRFWPPGPSSAADVILQWDSRPAQDLIFDASPREIKQYMDAVDRIQHSLPNDKTLGMAMSRLKNEFRAVLSRRANLTAGPAAAVDWSSVIDSTASIVRFEDYLNYDALNKHEIAYLSDIAKRLGVNGCVQDCVRAYINVRKPFLESQLRRLNFDELRIRGNGRASVWNDLKLKLELWVPVSKICVEIFFEREKKLCEQIFHDLGAAKDECFVGTVKDFAVKLFGFVEAISSSSQSHERMEPLIGFYSAVESVSALTKSLFSSELGKSVRNTCLEKASNVANDVIRLLSDFEKAVLHDSNDPSDNGGVHWLTEYVMDQTIVLLRHEQVLRSSIKSSPSLKFDRVTFSEQELGDLKSHSFVDRHLILIIAVLEKSLEGKSKRCKDSNLGKLFMMNNLNHIVRKIRASNQLEAMVGHIYVTKLTEKVKQAESEYSSSISSKAKACLRDDGLNNWLIPGRLSKSKLKERMDDFNKAMEDIRVLHSSRTIPDLVLRQNVRSSLSETLVPAYENFLNKFRERLKGKYTESSSIKHHSTGHLKAFIAEKLFEN